MSLAGEKCKVLPISNVNTVCAQCVRSVRAHTKCNRNDKRRITCTFSLWKPRSHTFVRSFELTFSDFFSLHFAYILTFHIQLCDDCYFTLEIVFQNNLRLYLQNNLIKYVTQIINLTVNKIVFSLRTHAQRSRTHMCSL